MTQNATRRSKTASCAICAKPLRNASMGLHSACTANREPWALRIAGDMAPKEMRNRDRPKIAFPKGQKHSGKGW